MKKSLIILMCLALLCGITAAQNLDIIPAYSEDFEATDGGWVSDNADGWQWGIPTYWAGPSSAHSGSNCWGTRIAESYGNNACFNMVLAPGLQVISADATFECWLWYNTETNWDGGHFLVSTDDGANWQSVPPEGGYPRPEVFGNPCIGGGVPVWAGASGDWLHVVIPIGQFNGLVPQYKFKFGSNDSYYADYGGLYVDDVVIYGLEGECDVLNPAMVDVSGGIPMCQCIDVCYNEPLIICFWPLMENEKPILYRFDEGCTGDPFRDNETIPGFGCDYVDCPPAYPDTVGEFYYSEELGGWCIEVVAHANGCFCVCIDDILPVELAGFEAIPADGEITLNWTTASEANNDRFEIMRDAALIGVVKASNSATGHSYSWTESNLTNGCEYTYSLVTISMDGLRETLGTISSTPNFDAASVTEYALHQNYPNPFNPETNISFDLAEAGMVKLTVFNPLGQTVATLVNGTMASGRHTIAFDGTNLTSGLYYYRLEAGDFSAIRKMILIK
ncbi:T9SS type A sorting domain-containing protein [bacterium]|nr:T9SS type A sorting domain-containing protein [bacterium]